MKAIESRLRSIGWLLWKSILARPLTTLYLLAGAIILAATANIIDSGHALIVLTFFFLALLLLGLHRENRIESRIVKAELDSIRMMLINRELIDKRNKGK